VTTISEIARAADVPVESVLRVLNRDDSVSRDVVARVEAVMDEQGYRPQGPNSEQVEPRPKPESPSEPSAPKRSEVSKGKGDRVTVSEELFDRLAADLDGIKNELGQARSERVEDLTLLVDLLTTSWRAAEHRLRAIEGKLERMEPTPEHVLEVGEGERRGDN
jgi:hypothetical protein